ncbi:MULTISPECIES: TOMM precursor leader peptide-binding protein [Nocardiopsis]|uniref:TOMM leader peptide-binding protein n=1 Tax=Nocardiopsis alba TaxID=53437 RepID=A0A7K2IVJ0_9ACTN|nr:MULTISPECIES: TOMM precursor leader peptide-binding protein [Nocardiopsis]MEC3895045.1 TOMM precursor leader peptide-binding protein [Nocardiopsis sp. LDBS1602]MYR33836.1 TOMM precursor leader peptide-binding protein [Nocardiopsis alba]
MTGTQLEGPTVIGAGILAEAMRATVPPEYTVVVGEAGELPEIPETDGPVLPVLARRDRLFIGPVIRPGRPGCPDCLESRLVLAREFPEPMAEIDERYPDLLRTWRPPALTSAHAGVAADLAVKLVELDRSAEDVLPVMVVRLIGIGARRARLLPDPMCATCGSLTDDNPEDTETLRPTESVAHSPGSLRTRSLVDDDSFLPTYVDRDMGLVRTLFKYGRGVFPNMSAPLGLRNSTDVEQGIGRTPSYRESGTAAVAEAVERWGGMSASGHRSVVKGTFADLPEAIDLRRLGLHDEHRYDEPGFPCRRWTEESEVDWVWARSLTKDAPVLVPETYAYYRTRLVRPNLPRYLYEVSNGCAVGGSMPEAILHGLMEVIERDAFLMTWYSRRSPAKLDLSTAKTSTMPLLLERIERQTGYTVHAWDTTTEHGIPSVWIGVVDEGEREGRARFLCASASHFDMESAVSAGLLELAPIIAQHEDEDEETQEYARRMVEDSELCTSMLHHSQLYGRPEAQDRLAFLYEGSERGLSEPHPALTTGEPTDLRALLQSTVDLLAEHGLEVIVVDQTTPEHRAGGLSCVKVIVPGMLPMTFGHRFRRVRGLDRAYKAAAAAGYDDVNPDPHPFP